MVLVMVAILYVYRTRYSTTSRVATWGHGRPRSTRKPPTRTQKKTIVYISPKALEDMFEERIMNYNGSWTRPMAVVWLAWSSARSSDVVVRFASPPALARCYK